MSGILNDILLPAIEPIGIFAETEKNFKTGGTTYSVMPDRGRGFFWTFSHQDQFAVSVTDVRLHQAVKTNYQHPAYYTISYYDTAPAGFSYKDLHFASRSLLTYSSGPDIFKSDLEAGFRGNWVSVTFTEEYVRKLAEKFGLELEEFSRLCFRPGGLHYSPAGTVVLKQLRSYTPSGQFASQYYEAKIVELFSFVCSEKSSGNLDEHVSPDDLEALNAVTSYLDQHTDESVNISSLVSIAYMSRTKLCETFKKHHHQTIHEYVVRKRIEQGTELLENTSLPIAEIARITGYQSQGSFGEVFKQQTGMTPRDYRKHLFTETIKRRKP